MTYEDPRFPNRKKKKWEEPDPGGELPVEELQDPNSEITPAEPLPVSGYHLHGSDPETPDDQPVEEELNAPIYGIAASEELNPIGAAPEADHQNPPAEPPIPQPGFLEVWTEWMRKFTQNPTRVYVAASVGLGILLGIVIVIVSWLMSPPNGRYDLGEATFSEVGLKGHMFIEWDKDKKVKYRLALEPSGADRQAAFVRAIANPPRPLSFDMHLQDSQGFVLCSREIVLKYDAGKTVADTASNGQLAQANDELQDAQEAKREQGKDIFQNQIGPDGQIAAINAQGDIPCSAKAYENTSYWSFSSNYPSLAEQDELLKRQGEAQASAARPSPQTNVARKRMAVKPAAKLLPFSIEGDDAIVEFDISNGIVETRGRKTFFVDKASAAGADSRWQDFPVSIHYRCDRTSNCMLMHSGLGGLRARLR